MQRKRKADSPSPGIAVPSSAKVVAPVQARTPPTSHIARAIPGEGTFASIEPGEVKTPLPMTMLTTMPNASMAPRFLVKPWGSSRRMGESDVSGGERRGCWSSWEDIVLWL